MPRSIRDLMPKDLEFQMFVLDELADDLIEQGADVLKLTIGALFAYFATTFVALVV